MAVSRSDLPLGARMNIRAITGLVAVFALCLLLVLLVRRTPPADASSALESPTSIDEMPAEPAPSGGSAREMQPNSWVAAISSSPDSGASRGSDSDESRRTVETDAHARSASEALAEARRLYSRSQNASQRGDDRTAFDRACRAWSLVQQFPDDSGCSELAATMVADLEALTERVDQSARTPVLPEVPLILD